MEKQDRKIILANRMVLWLEILYNASVYIDKNQKLNLVSKFLLYLQEAVLVNKSIEENMF